MLSISVIASTTTLSVLKEELKCIYILSGSVVFAKAKVPVSIARTRFINIFSYYSCFWRYTVERSSHISLLVGLWRYSVETPCGDALWRYSVETPDRASLLLDYLLCVLLGTISKTADVHAWL